MALKSENYDYSKEVVENEKELHEKLKRKVEEAERLLQAGNPLAKTAYTEALELKAEIRKTKAKAMIAAAIDSGETHAPSDQRRSSFSANSTVANSTVVPVSSQGMAILTLVLLITSWIFTLPEINV